MLYKNLKHGKGGGDKPIEYLLSKFDHNNKIRQKVEILHGNPEATKAMINSLDFKWKYSSLVIAWHVDDKPSPSQIEATINSWRDIAFAGISKDKHNFLAVQHVEDDDSIHVHIITPRGIYNDEKQKVMSFNPAPPNHEFLYSPWQSIQNDKHSWQRPDDPNRAKIRATPDIKYGEWNKSKEQISNYLLNEISCGNIENRAEIIQSLESKGFKIERENEAGISIAHHLLQRNMRLKNGIFAANWSVSEHKLKLEIEASRDKKFIQQRIKTNQDLLRKKLEKRRAQNQKTFGFTPSQVVKTPPPILEVDEEFSNLEPEIDLKNTRMSGINYIYYSNKGDIKMDNQTRMSARKPIQSFHGRPISQQIIDENRKKLDEILNRTFVKPSQKKTIAKLFNTTGLVVEPKDLKSKDLEFFETKSGKGGVRWTTKSGEKIEIRDRVKISFDELPSEDAINEAIDHALKAGWEQPIKIDGTAEFVRASVEVFKKRGIAYKLKDTQNSLSSAVPTAVNKPFYADWKMADYKNKINLKKFLLSEGLQETSKSGSNYSLFKDNDYHLNANDSVFFLKNSKDEWNKDGDKPQDIFNYLIDYKGLDQAGAFQYVRDYLGFTKSLSRADFEKSEAKKAAKEAAKKQKIAAEKAAAWKISRPYFEKATAPTADHSYLKARRIGGLCGNRLWSGQVKTTKTGAFFAHRNLKAELVGADFSAPTKKRSLDGGTKSLFASNNVFDRDCKTVVLSESAIDAISRSSTDNQDMSIGYVAAGGDMSRNQKLAIIKLCQGKQVEIAFDGDEGGQRQADRLMQAFESAGINAVVRNCPIITINKGGKQLKLKDWNDLLQNQNHPQVAEILDKMKGKQQARELLQHIEPAKADDDWMNVSEEQMLEFELEEERLAADRAAAQKIEEEKLEEEQLAAERQLAAQEQCEKKKKYRRN